MNENIFMHCLDCKYILQLDEIKEDKIIYCDNCGAAMKCVGYNEELEISTWRVINKEKNKQITYKGSESLLQA